MSGVKMTRTYRLDVASGFFSTGLTDFEENPRRARWMEVLSELWLLFLFEKPACKAGQKQSTQNDTKDAGVCRSLAFSDVSQSRIRFRLVGQKDTLTRARWMDVPRYFLLLSLVGPEIRAGRYKGTE